MVQVFLVFISAMLVNNFVLSRSLGICPFIGVSKKLETAVGMGLAVTFVLVPAAIITHLVYNHVLVRFNLSYLYIICFVLIIAALVQVVEMYIKRSSPTLYRALGIYLPLITTNCVVLGVVLINADTYQDSLLLAVVFAAGAGIGFTLAMVLFAGIRERLAYCNIPKPFQGMPAAMITAGLMSIAFLGFSGMISN